MIISSVFLFTLYMVIINLIQTLIGLLYEIFTRHEDAFHLSKIRRVQSCSKLCEKTFYCVRPKFGRIHRVSDWLIVCLDILNENYMKKLFF